jgi:hypothetical protein
VRRFVDSEARFLWLDDPKQCPAPSASTPRRPLQPRRRPRHLRSRRDSFGLDDDAAVQRLGELVHFIDVGGIPVDQAAGVEAVLRGLHIRHADDDALLAAACDVFDSLHAALGRVE